jgi:MFS family permease
LSFFLTIPDNSKLTANYKLPNNQIFLINKADVSGGALGYIIGGGISDRWGWRWAFRVR